MGWGTSEHEGYADAKRADGSWSGPTRRADDPDAVAYQAVCSCGWRSQREHPVPPPPADAPRDERGIRHGSAWDAWIVALEAANAACWNDWDAEHFGSLLDYEPHQHLVLARDAGGRRHFLDGRPVHAGTVLELLLADGRWLRVRYEWSWNDEPPTAHFALGAPAEAQRQEVAPVASLQLPSGAVLRWPAERGSDR